MNDSDKLQQLVALVTKLRAAQIAYFKTHGGLDEAKKIERAVDRWLADYAPSDQRRLFTAEERILTGSTGSTGSGSGESC